MTTHYLNKCWPDSLTHMCGIRGRWVNGLQPQHTQPSPKQMLIFQKSWWRHQMETFSALLAICAGNSPVSGEFPAQRPVTSNVDVFLICARINCWVNNDEGRWFEMPSHPLWHHRNDHLPQFMSMHFGGKAFDDNHNYSNPPPSNYINEGQNCILKIISSFIPAANEFIHWNVN